MANSLGLWPVDGPPPLPPLHGLLATAEAPASGVRIVPDVDNGVERWLGGVEVFPYPPSPGFAWDACAPGTDRVAKDDGPDVENPQFDPIVAYLPERCSARKIGDQAAYVNRATAALQAVQSAIVAREFLTGAESPVNPHLADGNGTILHGGTVTNPIEGLALLEDHIAQSGRLGVIHLTPSAATALGGGHSYDQAGKVLRTKVGTVVVVDAGYAQATPEQASPAGKAVQSGTLEWIYATGPIDIRQSEMFVVPGDISEALDRTTNEVVYRAERHFLVDWDVQVQAAVLIDRCRTAC